MGETWLRFGLLVIGAFASAVSVGVALWFALYAERATRTLQACAAVQGDPVAAATCDVADERHRVLFALAVGAAVVVLAVAGWAAQTVLRRRSLTRFPVPAVIGRSVVEPVLAGDRRARPALLWRARRPIAMARADGIVRPYVEVGSNWASLAVRDASTARAVFAHEMHHVRSRDVVASGTAYWLGPVVGVLGVAYIAQLVVLSDDAPVWGSVIRVAVIVAVIALGRAAVIRSREHEADLAAAGSEPDGIRRLVRGRGEPTRAGVRGIFRLHPSLAARANVIDRPWVTLRPGPGDGVLVGFSAAIGGQVFADLTRSVLAGEAVLQGDVVGWGIAGAVLGAWVTAMLLRSEAGSRSAGESRLVGFTALTALAASIGMVLFRDGIGLPIRWPDQLGLGLAGAVALWLGLQALVSWIRAAAERPGSVPVAGRRGGGAAAVVLGGLLGGLALGNVGTIATYADLLDQAGGAVGVAEGWALVGSVHAGSAVALVLVAVLVFGSLAVVLHALGRGRVARSRRTVVSGIVAGVVAAATAAGARALFADGGADPALAALVIQWSVSGVLVVGALVAATRVPLGPQRACLAAGVGAVTAAVGTSLLRLDPAAAPGVFLIAVGPAVLLSAVAAGLMAAVTRSPRTPTAVGSAGSADPTASVPVSPSSSARPATPG